MKQEIQVFDHAHEIMNALKTGLLLTTKADGKVNTMTISWGTMGIEWGKPIFNVYVRENRFTRFMLDKNPEFTINIPYGEFDKKILGYCGSRSGRNVDKIADLNLTLVDSDEINVPGIKELPMTLECKVLYKQLQNKDAIPQDIKDDCYPQDVDGSSPLANKDFHIEYYAEIVKAYIIK